MNFRSFDLFDALTSPVLEFLSRPSVLSRRILIQVNKEIPLNIRPLLGMRRMVHTKTISDFLSVYSLMNLRSGGDRLVKKMIGMLDMLKERSIANENGVAWGLGFPYATRFVNAGPETPNLFNTINSIQSILDYRESAGDNSVVEIVKETIRFLYGYLGMVYSNTDEAWLRYYPGQKVPNFNVNASAAAFFVRANLVFGEELAPADDIRKLLNFLTRNQNSDGSWYYAGSPRGKWIDGFHSGYILESLAYVRFVSPEVDLPPELERGVDFYLENLFTRDGIPKYFHDELYPIEAQNCAQAILTLSRLKLYGIRDTEALLRRVISNTLDYLYDPRMGRFYYKKGRRVLNKQVYLRWSHAPMIVALIYAADALKETL